jgi:hypothetical protein
MIMPRAAGLLCVLLMGFAALSALYGPLQSFFDKTWRPSEIELVK